MAQHETNTQDEQQSNGDDSADGVNDLEVALQAAKEEQLRLLAEMDNQRKRLLRDLESARKYGTERLLSDLLPVADSLERGLIEAAADPDKLRAGMDLTLRLLSRALEGGGAVALDPRGELFNPQLHQAVTTVPSSEHEAGTVVNVLQKGYRFHERLLRPALVAVASDPLPPEDA